MSTAWDRFWAKVDKSGECWLWTASTSHGYGTFFVEQVDGRNRFMGAHRWAYETLQGAVPEGLVLDHLCRVRACVNPLHLEPVTPKVNAERGEWGMRTHCPQGHPYDDENTGRRSTRDGRECVTCRRQAHQDRRERNRAALLADPTAAPHGSLTTYNDWMCRCPACRAAATEYRREQRARSVGRVA